MKICKNCGAENFDVLSFCDKCGKPITALPVGDQQDKEQGGLRIAAKVLMVISTVSYGISFLVCFAFWFIILITAKGAGLSGLEIGISSPVLVIMMLITLLQLIASWLMTRHYFEAEHISITFKVCTLLFVSMIAGILMLCDDGKKSNKQTKKPKNENNIFLVLEQYKNLLDHGLITQEEYDEKKKQLLRNS
ncbi:MAG: hypothetical protein E7350_00665 [Clostridiales bacterium]|nr:hypothetical protein [Clostridiales bacterium]